MKFIQIVANVIFLSIVVSVLFTCLLNKELSPNTVYLGLIHGSIIGLFVGIVNAFKKQFLHFQLRSLPFLMVSGLYSAIYFLAILMGRAIGIMTTEKGVFELFPLKDPNFTSTIIFVSGAIIFFNLIEQLSLFVGQKQLLNFATGKYRKSRKESRMIMFIDMKDSTKIAEQIGDELYVELLDRVFALMSVPLKESGGEIYKYIGDEAIITWQKNLIDPSIPIQFFKSFQKLLEEQAQHFLNHYSAQPTFRAGIHYGSMIIGELGSIKKEIALIGDSLNTTSRILQKAKTLNKELMVSELLGKRLSENNPNFCFENLGGQQLKGKEALMNLYSMPTKSSLSKEMNI